MATSGAIAQPQRRFFAETGVTNGAGNVTFNFPTPFPATPVVSHSIQGGPAGMLECRVTAISTTSVTFNVQQAAAITVALLGLTILLAPVAAAGVTVHCIATSPGATP